MAEEIFLPEPAVPPEEEGLEELVVPINESELDQFVVIRQADDLLKQDVSGFRALMLAGFPVDEFFAILNIEGEISPETMADAIIFAQEWFLGGTEIEGSDVSISPGSLVAEFVNAAARGREYGGAVGMATLEIGS